MTEAPSSRRRGAPVAVQVSVILALSAVVGAASGWLWFKVWDAPTGIVFDGTWYADEAGLRGQFPSTGWFVVIGAGAGLLLGILCAVLLDRAELVTLGAVLVGAVLATYLMWQVGLLLSPEDPQKLAAGAADGDMLPGRIAVSGQSPFLVLPGAALSALAVTFALLPRRERKPRSAPEHAG